MLHLLCIATILYPYAVNGKDTSADATGKNGTGTNSTGTSSTGTNGWWEGVWPTLLPYFAVLSKFGENLSKHGLFFTCVSILFATFYLSPYIINIFSICLMLGQSGIRGILSYIYSFKYKSYGLKKNTWEWNESVDYKTEPGVEHVNYSYSSRRDNKRPNNVIEPGYTLSENGKYKIDENGKYWCR